MEQFHVVLPSNSCMRLHPDNTISSYAVTLCDEIHLTGNGWEVALTELTYPNNVYTLQTGECAGLTYTRTDASVCDVFTTNLKEGFYESPKELIEHIRACFDREWTDNVKEDWGEAELPVKIQYNEMTNKVTVYTKLPKFGLKLSPLLAGMLGLVKPGTGMEWTGDSVDLKRGRHSIHVYCSLICDTHVADKKTPLLRTLPLRGSRDSLTCETIAEPNYVGVKTLTFRTIEVNLRTETGDPISFTSGHSIATLRFRRNVLA
jgi:hypothetical protein